MKKIKLPLEMANGVMVRSLEELKENWDLEKIVSHFGDGSLVTWLNDRYYTDLAEQVQKITATGAEAQKQLCAVFGMEFSQDEVVDEEAVAERKRKLDILRQFTSDDEVLKNVDHVAFNQEDLADLLDEGVEKIYLCNGKFNVPLSVSGKKYIGVVGAEVYIGKDELIDFDKLGISFENVKFDEKYQKLVEKQREIEEKKKQEEIDKEKALKAKQPGQIIKLGHYDQENIEWVIIDIVAGQAKVVSKYVINAIPYQDDPNFVDWRSMITWETCTLRRWLNCDFYNTAFSEEEKKVIRDSLIISKDMISGRVEVISKTKDKIFIVDEQDARNNVFLHHSKITGQNILTEGTRRRLSFEMSCVNCRPYDGMGCWIRLSENASLSTEWPINPGCTFTCNGEGYFKWEYNNNSWIGVRPAMWVDLSKL